MLLRFASLFATLFSLGAAAEVERITPAEAAKRVAAGTAVIVDVREPDEWEATGVAEPAKLLPKSDFDGSRGLWNPFLANRGDKQVIVYCRTGRRSQIVAEQLAREGIPAANSGGFSAWAKAGLPTRTAPASTRD